MFVGSFCVCFLCYFGRDRGGDVMIWVRGGIKVAWES